MIVSVSPVYELKARRVDTSNQESNHVINNRTIRKSLTRLRITAQNQRVEKILLILWVILARIHQFLGEVAQKSDIIPVLGILTGRQAIEQIGTTRPSPRPR